jgi:ABC-type sugar transport system ATPase subunit
MTIDGTHDQVEAITLAQTIVVPNARRIEQVGAPLDLHHQPAKLFIAGFIGSPQMNLRTSEVRHTRFVPPDGSRTVRIQVGHSREEG